MKNIINFAICIGFVFTFATCKKTVMSSNADCTATNLTICKPEAPDMWRFVIRPDSSWMIGHSTSIKSVPGIGEIEWSANNRIVDYGTEFLYLDLANYQDTSWYGYDGWAFLRETVFIAFPKGKLGYHEIRSDKNYPLSDPPFPYAHYLFNHDDLFGVARWDIDESCPNGIVINSYDETTKIMEGEYDLNFKIRIDDWYTNSYGFASKVHFRCGKFKAKVRD